MITLSQARVFGLVQVRSNALNFSITLGQRRSGGVRACAMQSIFQPAHALAPVPWGGARLCNAIHFPGLLRTPQLFGHFGAGALSHMR